MAARLGRHLLALLICLGLARQPDSTIQAAACLCLSWHTHTQHPAWTICLLPLSHPSHTLP